MTLTTGFLLVISALALGTAPAFATDVTLDPNRKTLNERLIEATRNGNLGEVKTLIRAGAKVDARTESYATPLILAVSTGNVAIVQTLLKAGADVNAKEGLNGETALMYAARAGNIPLVRILLDAKAQINLKDDVGRTALHRAVGGGNIEVMELLLAAGADPSTQDSHFLGTTTSSRRSRRPHGRDSLFVEARLSCRRT